MTSSEMIMDSSACHISCPMDLSLLGPTSSDLTLMVHFFG